VYLNFINKHCIQDPCRNKPGYKRIIACFIKQLIFNHNSQSATICRYVEAINTLFRLHQFNAPANLTNHSNMCSKIILAREKEESIARQQSPITQEIYSTLIDQANRSPVNSVEMVVADWFTLIRITGLCCAEYAQKTQTSYDEHKYPLGKRVIKAFNSSDWKFYNSRGRLIIDPKEILKKLKTTFRIQKHRQNGQSITLVANNTHHDICPVRAAHCIFLRAKNWANQTQNPWASLLINFGIKKYLTEGKIAKVLQSIAKRVHPDLFAEELCRISLHSGRVWALVLLDEAGMSPAFMTS
jgi:hypothetical protein